MKTNVLFASTKKIISEGITNRLKNEPLIALKGWVTDPADLQRQYDEHKPDCLLVGITLFGEKTLQGLRDFKRQNPDANLLLLSLSSTQQFVKQVLDTGVKGIFSSPFSSYEHLIFGIHCVAGGRAYLCKKSTELMFGDFLIQKIVPAESDTLSVREKQVVKLIAESHSSKEIAHLLSISPATVDVHRRNIMRKMGVRKVADITKYAIRSEMIFI